MKKGIVLLLISMTLWSLASCGIANAPAASGSDKSGALSSAAASDATASSKPADSAPASSAAGQSESGATSSANGKKLRASVPDGWTAITGSVLEYQFMKNTASFMMKTENFSGSTLDEVVAEAEEIFKSSFGNFQEEGNPETIEVAGTDARKIVFTCQVGKISMKYMYVYLFVGKNLYAVTFGDLQTTFDSLAGDYQAILDSMTVE